MPLALGFALKAASSRMSAGAAGHGRRRRERRRAATPLLGLLLCLLGAAAVTAQPEGAPRIVFRDSAAAWGIDFRHHHGGSGRRYMVETMAGGVVVFDYDGDGDQDLFFVDGGRLPGYDGEPARSRLLRNDGGSFRDVTAGSGLVVEAYGNGGTAGDIDGDGDTDLYVTALGPNQLFVNNGDGTFSDSTERAGVGDPLWGASAAFGDVDRDGDLDLYLANYVEFTVELHRDCNDPANGLPIYCHPSTYPGQPDRFWRNLGDGRFEDATAAAGFDVDEDMAGLGVVFGDVDEDGWPDLYVANDTEPNFLFLSRGDGRVEESAFLSGTAVSERGMVEAGMGVDLGDVDADGLLDIVVTNFEMETNALYRNLGSGVFVDSRYPLNVAEPSLLPLAFGVALADLDHDADLDLVIANGHVRDNAASFHATSTYGQRNQVLENLGNGRFREVEDAGLDQMRVSRGLATGDLDGDGDLDAVVVNSNDLAEAYENRGAAGGWLLVDLVGAAGNRDGVHTRARLRAGGREQIREARTASSYQSQSASSLHFGLGRVTSVERLDLAWPSGRRQRLLRLPAERRLRIFEPATSAATTP